MRRLHLVGRIFQAPEECAAKWRMIIYAAGHRTPDVPGLAVLCELVDGAYAADMRRKRLIRSTAQSKLYRAER
jgi:hypothetical protein